MGLDASHTFSAVHLQSAEAVPMRTASTLRTRMYSEMQLQSKGIVESLKIQL